MRYDDILSTDKLDIADDSTLGSSQLSDLVYDKLRGFIIAGEYKPNASIAIKELSRKFGVSNTPVREALNKLENDGLVEKIPYHGYKIKEFSAKEIKNIYETRAAIESFAAKLAAKRIEHNEKKELENIHSLSVKYYEDNDLQNYHKTHQKLHHFIVQKSKNETFQHKFRNLFLIISLFVLQTVKVGGRPLKAIKEHEKIIEAINNGQSKRAQVLMEEHIIDGMEDYLKEMKNQID